MKIKIISIIVTFVVVLSLLLFQATRSGTSTVLTPKEALTLEGDFKKIRIAGKVTSDEYEYQIEPELKLEFRITDPEKESGVKLNESIKVIYYGLKPDMFSAGRDVIIDGEVKSGIIYAYNLLTQCPSKYEAPIPIEEN